jgi:hypothetical protein
MDQSLINWILAGFSALVGFLLHAIWDAVKDLQAADTAIAAKVSNIEILVAGSYVKREELKQYMDAVFTKLDRIDGKLDGKADK